MAVEKSATAPAAKTAETAKAARVVKNATSMASGGEIVFLLAVMVLLAGSAIAVALIG